MVADLSRVDESFDTAELKVAQLAFREAEIEETVRVLRAINDGSGSTIFEMNPRKEGEDLVNWEGRLDMNNVTMAGHSYGATGALQALKGAPCKERPFHGGLILDPYVPLFVMCVLILTVLQRQVERTAQPRCQCSDLGHSLSLMVKEAFHLLRQAAFRRGQRPCYGCQRAWQSCLVHDLT